MLVDISYAASQVHGIINVALHREYSPDIVFIFFQGRNVTPDFKAKTNAHRMYAQDEVVIHTARM
jgi:hypothetical protein